MCCDGRAGARGLHIPRNLALQRRPSLVVTLGSYRGLDFPLSLTLELTNGGGHADTEPVVRWRGQKAENPWLPLAGVQVQGSSSLTLTASFIIALTG